MSYTLRKENYEKVNGKWLLAKKEEIANYSFEKWKTHILDSSKFFKSLGGTERLKGNTLTSISPDGNNKSVYTLKKNNI